MNRILLATVLALAIGAAISTTTRNTEGVWQMTPAAWSAFSDELDSLRGATAWINSEPLAPKDLEGKVVLVEFWTYSCINWLRVQPYVRAWAEKYKDKGLVVIGVHTPEFGFEKNLDNIRWAAENLRVSYPIDVDTDYAIWSGFSNQYWPALYLIDSKGKIRHRQFGEGGYEKSETVIQQLLAETGKDTVSDEFVSVDGTGAEAAADWTNLGSPETYLGYARTDNFASPGGAERNMQHTYGLPSDLRLNHWALAGQWTLGKEAIVLDEGSGRIAYRFRARDVHLVMGPSAANRPVPFRVLVDGLPPGDAHGVDIDAAGNGTATRQRLYQLIRQPAKSTIACSRSSSSIPASRPSHSPLAE
jgi:thiol-disulfide isomerase/thioredoxin